MNYVNTKSILKCLINVNEAYFEKKTLPPHHHYNHGDSRLTRALKGNDILHSTVWL